MPLAQGWATYRRGKPPDAEGVYELAYGGNLVYIGSGNIEGRIARHDDDPSMSFRKYRSKVTNNSRRAVQLERRELKNFQDNHGRLPKYNDRIPAPP